MDDFKAVQVRLALARKAIPYRVLFEKSMTMAGAYVMGQHGAIFEVLRADYNAADAALRDAGFDRYHDAARDRFRILDYVENLTRDVPLFNRLPVAFRLVLSIGLLFFFAMLSLL